MTPPKRAASYASSRYSDAAADAEQFGRSSLSLNVDKVAASIRRTTTTKEVKEKAGTTEVSPYNTDNISTACFDFDFASPLDSELPTHFPFTPSVSSPLRSTFDPSAYSNDSSEQTTRSKHAPETPLESRNKSTSDLQNHTVRSSASRLTLKHLGSNYSRYYNPFADTPKIPSSRSSGSDKKRSIRYPPPRTATPLAALYPTNPFLTPNGSTTKFSVLHDQDNDASFVDDRLVAPYDEKGMASWPLIGDEEEPDDDMHMPHPDDDIRYRPRLKDYFSLKTLGLFLMTFGFIFFIGGLPVLSRTGIISYNPSYGVPIGYDPHDPNAWAKVNDRKYPFLKNIRTGLIDPDTPQSAMTKTGEFGNEYQLVFSDEFNDDNRTFYEGDDPYFFAGDFWYGATKDLAWYDPDAVTTKDGTLELRLDKFINHGLNFRSGMLNSWNQLCFKGGIFEISASLPGPAGVPGLWPGAWTMGNLGRPGYLSTTDGLWPYTYQACDVGISPNQSSYDGLSNLPGQRLNSCTCPGADHPTPGKGRGAPEIDIIEVGATWPPQSMPIATQSFQVAPFDIWWYPNYNFTAFPDYTLSYPNGYTGGPYQQAISATTNLNKDWFDGKAYQRYSFEYVPGEGEDAYISWKVGGDTMFMMDGRAIGPNGNIQARQVSEEPMSLILNLGFSNAWTWIDWEHLVFPAVMRVDYVRWYQKPGEKMVTCDPPGFETTK